MPRRLQRHHSPTTIPPLAAADVIARVGHDLRQPLQALLFGVHHLAEVDDAQRRRSTAQRMEQAVLALQAMLDAIGWLGRPVTQSERSPWQEVALADIFGGLVAQLDEVCAGDAPGLRIHHSPAAIATDLAQLQLALAHLVLNAAILRSSGALHVGCRRRPGGGRIWITYEGAPPPRPSVRSLFVEWRPPTRQAAPVVRPVMGLPLIALFAARLGASLEHGHASDRRHELALDLGPPTQPNARTAGL